MTSSTTTPVVVRYRNRAVVDEASLQRIRTTRAIAMQRRLVLNPVDAYEVAFARRLDPQIVRSVRDFLASRKDSPGVLKSRPGSVYAFRVDGTTQRLIKVGRTRQLVRRRLKQWDTSLGGQGLVQGLFSFRTADQEFAEQVLQRSLVFEWRPRLVNVVNGTRVNEFYKIDDYRSLQFFMQLVAAYTDSLLARASQT